MALEEEFEPRFPDEEAKNYNSNNLPVDYIKFAICKFIVSAISKLLLGTFLE